MIQPVSIAYVACDDLPLSRSLRPCFAWYGDMLLAPHLWRLAGLGKLTVRIVFHAPVSPARFPCRKSLAAHCQGQVAAGAESTRCASNFDTTTTATMRWTTPRFQTLSMIV